MSQRAFADVKEDRTLLVKYVCTQKGDYIRHHTLMSGGFPLISKE
jgi:hypothetical protein